MTESGQAIDLKPMQENEFKKFREDFVNDWAVDISRAEDLDVLESVRQAIIRTDEDLPNGLETKGHHLFIITRDNQPIGTLWFSTLKKGRAFLDDITLYPQFRGLGYGRQVLDSFEAKAKELGVSHIDLYVYAHNSVVFELYKKSGYQTVGFKMHKRLTD